MELNRTTTDRLWIVSIILFIITSVAVFIKIASSPDIVALRFNVIVGVDEVGSRYELIKLPLTGLILGAMNFILARVQKLDRVFLPFLAALITVLINTLLLIAALFLFRVN